MSDAYEIQISVRGVATTHETNYGTRTDRDTLATLVVPVSSGRAWDIFATALAAATEGHRDPPLVSATAGDRKAVVSEEGGPR